MADVAQGQPQTGTTLRELQPTVFIGLGGTGKEVLLRVRRQILSTRWKDVRLSSLAQFPIAQFMYFDVDTQTAKESDRAAASDLLSSAVGFAPSETLQKFLDLQLFLSNRRAYPLIDEFFPRQELSGINVLHGAAQIRVLSRLYFFQRYQEFKAMLQSKASAAVASMQNSEEIGRLGLNVDPANRYRVVIVASAAGGTGSGSFLDVGYLANTFQNPSPESVTLILFLGGAFQDANMTRVYANTFAALKELEGCMRNSEWPRYVTKWAPTDQLLGQIYPYKDVYLIDNANVLQERTSRKDDLFAMVASILFEDFGSSEFARHKRSVGSNNQPFKALLYTPPMPDGYENALAYSTAYSSFGQAIVETTSHRLFERRNYDVTAQMLQGFYSVGEQRKANTVTDEQLTEFLEKKLYLGETGFKVLADPTIQRVFPRAPGGLPPSLKLYALVERLLMKPDGSTLYKGVLERVDGAIDAVKTTADFSQWKARVEEAFRELEISLQGTVGAKDAAPRAREIDDAARRIMQEWTAQGSLGLKAEIYRMVEDHQRGGIHYALDLMRQTKDRLGDRKHGVIGTLATTRDEFKLWAEKCQAALYAVPLQNLTEISPRKRSQGESILSEGVKPLMSKYAELQLYALACDRAIEMLETVSGEFFGKPEGSRDDGTPLWTGLLGDVDDGRQRLIELVAELGREIAQLDDRRETPMQQYIEDGYKLGDAPSIEEAIRWAKAAFDKLQIETGTLFAGLATPDGKLKVMESLRQWVREQFSREEKALPTIGQALTALGDRAQDELAKLMRRAAPWIDADTQRMEGFKNEQYKMFLAVEGKGLFEQRFGGIIDKARPFGFLVSVVESGTPGKLVCYSELSGVTLNTLTPVRSTYWDAYKRERRGIPLHTHHDEVRFPNPIVPDQAAIDEQGQTVKTYLQSVVFGILQRGSEAARGETGDKAPAYFIQRNPGEWGSIGVERFVLEAAPPEMLAQLRHRVDEIDPNLTPLQCLALSALFGYYQQWVYPKKVVTNFYQQERDIPRFESAVAGALAKDYQARYTRSVNTPAERERASALMETLREQLDKWSREIPGSAADIAREGGSPTNRPKRTVVAAAFEERALRGLVDAGLGPSGVGGISTPPPIPGAARYHIGVNGEAKGPFSVDELRSRVADGSLRAETLVWAEGFAAWMPAAQVPEVAALFAAGRQPPPLPR